MKEQIISCVDTQLENSLNRWVLYKYTNSGFLYQIVVDWGSVHLCRTCFHVFHHMKLKVLGISGENAALLSLSLPLIHYHNSHLLSFTASNKSSLSSLQLSTDREWITSSSRQSAAATLLTFSSSLYLCWGLAQLVPARLSVALERINGM